MSVDAPAAVAQAGGLQREPTRLLGANRHGGRRLPYVVVLKAPV